ncbi:MAG: V-type proton ATPase subunit E [Christensenella sp.]|nr:V-type proton ATPase subunit E [Christensenella sp.]
MNNKEVIIDKIISDAKAQVDEIISKAQEEVKNIEKTTNDSIQKYRDVELPKGDKQAKEILSRKQMVTNLDCKKLVLSKKTAIIDSIFNSIASDLRKNKKQEYIDLIINMISKVCDDKDEVIISKFDKDIITDAVIEKAAKKSGKKISLSKKQGDFIGGVILSGEKFDKNLTLEVEFEEIKQQKELEITQILFGE